MAYPMLPEKIREEFSDAIEADSEPYRQELRLIRQLIAKKDFGTVLEKAEALAEKADRNPLLREDAVSRYFNFAESVREESFRKRTVMNPKLMTQNFKLPFIKADKRSS